MSAFTWLWIIWLAQFGAIEGVALFHKQSDATLSGHIWRWFSTRDKSTGWLWRRAALLAFLGWLVAHLMRWI